jgi:hypothetical protein
MQDQLDATNDYLLAINNSSTCFGRLYSHHQNSRLRVTAYDFLFWLWLSWESVGETSAEDVAWIQSVVCSQATSSAQCTHLATRLSGITTATTRTGNHQQWHAVCSPDDGRKDARNMLRNNWSPINRHLLHLVGLAIICLSKMYGHSNIKRGQCSKKTFRITGL